MTIPTISERLHFGVQTGSMAIMWDSAIKKMEEEFHNGPEGVTLSPGEGATVYRILKELGLV